MLEVLVENMTEIGIVIHGKQNLTLSMLNKDKIRRAY